MSIRSCRGFHVQSLRIYARSADDPNLAGQVGEPEMNSCLPDDKEQRRRAKNRATAKVSR